MRAVELARSGRRVLLRILVELLLADHRAEVIRLALVLALAGGLRLVDLHVANGIGHHDGLLTGWHAGQPPTILFHAGLCRFSDVGADLRVRPFRADYNRTRRSRSA